jgi:hypothetical protein
MLDDDDDEESQRVTTAMLEMTKLDLAELEGVYANE